MSKTVTLWLSNPSGNLPAIPLEVYPERISLDPEDYPKESLDKWELEKLMKKAGMESYPEAIKRLEREGNSLAASSLEKQQEKILQLAVNVVDVEEGETPVLEKDELEEILNAYLEYR